MINNVTIMGRLTANPEIKSTQTGKSVTTFCIAVDRYQKGESDFINIVAWNKTAEFIGKYFTKGQMIAINGRIETRKYQDKNGNTRSAFEVIAENVSFCGDKANSEKDINVEPEEEDDYLPF